ncbi:DUF134 domain-containing protein [Tepidibacter aestuarii]|uniref:DUF134 domain-containing protein n=1 Tax=Tepidibacter aestuarii TaxID=2925782 RepID=UPI0020C0AAF7|nr:DUF134 domain-containing protein [Tepidibacter aestuarii]CAH2212275.1 conserved protein of unknown function [Tepidibacter aestuarii]
MARPTKVRTVEFFPENNYFVPVGKQKCDIEEVEVKIEELEAMRLKDIEGLNQEECAKKMQVSRQTFQNIIDSARKKVAVSLTEGKAIRISGGHYTTKHCRFKCMDCGNEYNIKYSQDKKSCPDCGLNKVTCTKKVGLCKKLCEDK